ncbi:HsdR family type I site-specific deoxyribonuclease [Actinomadura fulvescens]|uniref:Type I restriction enzyme endonuclease subunit n=1 Tax=Actinomadura fulvescens TaxID=46160 RepID=A0ABN3PX91_9ACTN
MHGEQITDRLADLLVTHLGWVDRLDAALPGTVLSDEEALRDGLLRDRFLEAVRQINPATDGRLWLDEPRLDQVWESVTRRLSGELVQGNEEFFEVLQSGVVVDGPSDDPDGRRRAIRLVDWDNPELNDLLVATRVPVQRPRDGGIPKIELDAVLFVNGIPFVVVACSSAWQTDGVNGAIDVLRTYTGRRRMVPNQSLPGFFRYVQVLVATDGEQARLGTVTSLPEHFAEWKTTEPVPGDRVASEIGADRPLTSLETLAAGALRASHLIDLVHSFSIFQRMEGKTTRLVARYQQFRAVHRIVRRMTEESRPEARGGLLWHTQGSGKSLTMVFLVRKLRNSPRHRGFKVVVVSDRRALKRQLTPVLRLSGEKPRVAENSAEARTHLTDPTPNVIQLMIQQARKDDTVSERELSSLAEDPDDVQFAPGLLNDSDQILLLIDEAHRTQSGMFHARLRRAVPNATVIGLTGTPIIRSDKANTARIFGKELDRYTLTQAEQDEATVPIRYEGRHSHADVVDRVALDTAYEAETGGAQAVLGLRDALESSGLIAEKARDMLVHWVTTVLPRGFKAQVVAVSRVAAVRYRAALRTARDDLVKAAHAHRNFGGSHDGFDEPVLAAAAARLSLLRAIDFVPIISGSEGDPPELREWTDQAAQYERIDRFQAAFPAPEPDEDGRGPHPSETQGDPWQDAPAPAPQPSAPEGGDPWDGLRPDTTWNIDVPAQSATAAPIAFLIVQRMLLTGFDAPLEQVLYVDRPIRQAELLQAIARTNRRARNKPYGLVVDYVALTENLDSALAEYELKDLEGMREELIKHELPLLLDRASQLKDLLRSLGVTASTAEEEQERLLELLENRDTRARFDATVSAFLNAMDRLLPRPEALVHEELAQVVGLVQWRARRRFRDTGTGRPDPNQYGPVLRELLDKHIQGSRVIEQVPPVEITDPGFREKVDELRSDRTRAREYEHALRHHIDSHRALDPQRADRLSERLDHLLRSMDGAWDDLAPALRTLIDETLQPEGDITTLGLDPHTEGPIYSILAQALSAHLESGRLDEDQVIDIVHDLAGLVRVKVVPPHFRESTVLQENLRKDLTRRVRAHTGLALAEARPIAQRLVTEVAVSRRDHFL